MPKIVSKEQVSDREVKMDTGVADHLKQTHDYAAIRDIIADRLDVLLSSETPYILNWEEKKYIGKHFGQIPASMVEDVRCTIAVVAPVSSGKSTLLNVVCEYPILPAASGVTSAVPTYIMRANDHSSESVTVFPLNKTTNAVGSTRYVRDERNKKAYSASDISRELFEDLLSYALLVMRGNGTEYGITIENIAYFMSSTEAVDIEFLGYNDDKMSLSDAAFGLSYENPRHRLLLLLILVCVYVRQNESNENYSAYRKDVNAKRIALMKKCGFPAEGDYCVDLKWCSNSVPDGVTLIDLPGTGSATKEKGGQSSHTQLVKGILFDADAVWVLASDNGTVEVDLLNAITDAVDADPNKNRVCIYNCRNGHPNDSKPVSDFVELLPCLIGERCFVVNALAGEYKFIQNGVKAENTKFAAKRRFDDEDDDADKMIKKLSESYCSAKKAMPTYMSYLEKDAVIVRQEVNVSYTLETFLKVALTDYVSRLKYEIIIKKAMRQLSFYETVRTELENTYKLLVSINGRGPEIAKAVNDALQIAYRTAIGKYTTYTIEEEGKISKELAALSPKLGPMIKNAFGKDYGSLIEKIHAEWKTLITSGHKNKMEKNFFGNYSLKLGHPNWTKFKSVRENVDKMITIAAFSQAAEEADSGIAVFRGSLQKYIDGLKKITHNFCNDYMNSFSVEYDIQREKNCVEKGKIINDTLWENFGTAKKQLTNAIAGKLDSLCTGLCLSLIHI